MFRRWAPWAAWGIAAAAAVTMNFFGNDLGTAPAAARSRSVALTSPVALRLASLEVGPGQLVTEGQVVARLDATLVEGRLKVARALLAAAESKVSAKEVELRVGTGRVADKEATEAERAAVDLAALQADEQSDRAKLAQLDEQIERETRLVQGQLSSAAALNELKLARAAVSQTVQNYGVTLKRAQERHAAAARRAGEWRGQGAAAPMADQRLQAQLAPVKAEVVYAREEVAALEKQLVALELRAPFAGRVGQVLLQPGETVRSDTPVLFIVDEQPRVVVAYVDQAWAGNVQLGDEVKLEAVDRAGTRRLGRVTAMGPGLVETPARFRAVERMTYSREVHVLLDGDAGGVLPGQAFRADFRRGSLGANGPAVGAR